ncbi:MAG TPA: trehalose-phosphatase [Acidimicrobiales bacterium]|jgi:trehalose 6-phosphate phosphatase|nr:trehalose-phosphatase [Acidimicrobiales bacterium]
MTSRGAESLDAHVRLLARAPILLVASDFDGTLAPIVSTPSEARPIPRAVGALERLARLPDTHVAIVSGRSLDDLADLVTIDARVERLGSHGLEFDAEGALGLDTKAHGRLRRLSADLTDLAAGVPGAVVEHKPYSVAFHVRNADPQLAQPALRHIVDAIAARDGVWCKPGHEVVELLVLPASKSWALDALRARHPGAVVLYVGDDATDEDVFADLRPGDLGCKVGAGPTRAPYRVDGPEDVADLLEALVVHRARVHEPEEQWV